MGVDREELEDSRITIWAMGMKRSGTHWLSWLLGDALNSPVHGPNDHHNRFWVVDGKDRPGQYLVRQAHRKQQDGGIIILIVRDPRDVLLSQMKYWKASYNHRKQWLVSWSRYYEQWAAEASAIVRYEDLHENCPDALAQALEDAGIPFEPERISQSCRQQRFEVKKDWKSQGRAVPANFFWQGKVGGWKEGLKPAEAKAIVDAHAKMMKRFGYE